MAEPRPLVVIENSTLLALAANKTALKEFPFLAALRPQGGRRGCGGCGRPRPPAGDPYASARAAIAGLGPDKKRKLKELLNARQVRLFYLPPGGKKPVALTFG